jgi:hypothetical protein
MVVACLVVLDLPPVLGLPGVVVGLGVAVVVFEVALADVWPWLVEVAEEEVDI